MKKREARKIRHRRIRAKVRGTAARPRAAVFRSNKHISVQVIDDENGKTLFAVHDLAGGPVGTKRARAKAVGERLADEAAKRKVGEIVFDRGGYLYAGRVRELAEAARSKGLNF